jgi:hypothetical protein
VILFAEDLLKAEIASKSSIKLRTVYEEMDIGR